MPLSSVAWQRLRTAPRKKKSPHFIQLNTTDQLSPGTSRGGNSAIHLQASPPWMMMSPETPGSVPVPHRVPSTIQDAAGTHAGLPTTPCRRLTSASLLQMFEAPGHLQRFWGLLSTGEVNSLVKSLWALHGSWHLHRHLPIDTHLHQDLNAETSMKTWPRDECGRSTAGLSSCLAGQERDGTACDVLEEKSLCFSLHPRKGIFFQMVQEKHREAPRQCPTTLLSPQNELLLKVTLGVMVGLHQGPPFPAAAKQFLTSTF